MSIAREKLKDLDLSDVTSDSEIKLVHPGEVLREEFLKPFGLSIYMLAKHINIPRSRVNDITRGQRAITVDTALRLSRFFGTSAEFWLNLQSKFDLERGQKELSEKIKQEIVPHMT